MVMSDAFVNIPGSDDRPVSAGRRSVRMFLMGDPDDVERTIAELHTKQFGEVNLWSKPLRFPETQHQFALNPGEVMRVYKRYLSR
jgi:hypothetical protein